MGPFKIVNNFLEASGENILLGGGAATVTPADIEIRHNHMFRGLHTTFPENPGKTHLGLSFTEYLATPQTITHSSENYLHEIRQTANS